MTNPTIREHNLETDEIIDREMNDQELAQWNIINAEVIAKEQAEEAAKTATDAAAAKLAAFGLTIEDLQALGLIKPLPEEPIVDEAQAI